MVSTYYQIPFLFIKIKIEYELLTRLNPEFLIFIKSSTHIATHETIGRNSIIQERVHGSV